MFLLSNKKLRERCLLLAMRGKEIECNSRVKCNIDWVAEAELIYNYIKHGAKDKQPK